MFRVKVHGIEVASDTVAEVLALAAALQQPRGRSEFGENVRFFLDPTTLMVTIGNGGNDGNVHGASATKEEKHD